MCLLALAAILGAAVSVAPASNVSRRSFEQRIEASVSHAVHLRYLVYQPEAYASN